MNLLKILKQAYLFLRSLLFSCITIVFTILYCVICILCWPLPIALKYKVVRVWTHMIVELLRYLCGIKYSVKGVENIPTDRAGVVLCKHQSAWETFFLPRFFDFATVIVKKELFWVPFFGWGLASMNPIAINRKEKKSAMQQVIEIGRKRIESGCWVIFYPEGTRISPGEIGKYKAGGARLAVATGAPVIPVAHNAGYFWPKRGFLKREGTVEFEFGPIIETVGKTPEKVLSEAKDWIENKIQNMTKY